jgi:hypothetical protein
MAEEVELGDSSCSCKGGPQRNRRETEKMMYVTTAIVDVK